MQALTNQLAPFLLQDGPAETSAYMLLGFAVILGIMAAYLASLVVRMRNRRSEAAMLQQILDERAAGGEQDG